MNKDDSVYIDHIKQSLLKIILYTESLSKEDFAENEMVQDAVIRNFEIIGEAAKNLSAHIRQTYYEIPWREIAGMRDKLIHHYMGVDVAVVWKTIEKDIPVLREMIQRINI